MRLLPAVLVAIGEPSAYTRAVSDWIDRAVKLPAGANLAALA